MGKRKTRCKQKEGKRKIPKHPEFQCKKCGGLAKKKKRICKPVKL